MEDIVDFLKNKLKKNLVAIIQFGSSVYNDKHEDTDLMIVVNKPTKINFPDHLIKKYRLSPIIITKRDFAVNCIEKSPLFVGMIISGFKILYGHNFVYKWLPALINRMNKTDILYHKHRVKEWKSNLLMSS